MKSKVGEKLLLQGSATQIKGRNNIFFSLCFDTKISDCSQFIVLCPRLVSLRAVEQQVGSYHAGAALDFTWILRHFYPSLSQKLSCLKTPGENNHPRHLCCRLNKHKYPLRKKTQKCLTHFKAAGGIWALMSQRGEMEETQGAPIQTCENLWRSQQDGGSIGLLHSQLALFTFLHRNAVCLTSDICSSVKNPPKNIRVVKTRKKHIG